MKNKLIHIKKSKFIKALKREFHNDEFFKTKVDKIEIEVSKTINGKKTITLNAYGLDLNEETKELRKDEQRNLDYHRRLSYTFIEKEEKLALIYHIIALLCDHEFDLAEYWNYILEYPDELVESEYDDDFE